MNLTDLRPDRTLDPAGLEHAHDLLRTRLGDDADGTAPLDELAPRRRRGATRLALVGVAAAAVAVVAVALPNPTDTAAFAGWTAVPAQVGAEDLAVAGAECAALRGIPTSPTDPTNLSAARAAVADRRGGTTFTVLASDAGLQWCLVGPDVASSAVVSGGQGDMMSGGGSSDGEWLGVGVVGSDDPVPADGATYVAGGIDGVGAATPWGSALGRIGPEVASVEVLLTDGSTVSASVNDGVWAAWWPTEQLAAEVRPTLEDGTAGTAPQVDQVDIEVVLREAEASKELAEQESAG